MRPNLIAAAFAVMVLASAHPATAAERPILQLVQGNLIDINSATLEQLRDLKGIGPVRARAIVEGRPYRGKDELVHKKIIPQAVYDDIEKQIIARQR